MDLKEGRWKRGLAQAAESEEGDEEEEETPLVRKGRKMVAPRKRKQATPGSMSTPKKTKVRGLDSSFSSFSRLRVYSKIVLHWSF